MFVKSFTSITVITSANAVQNILDESIVKPNKIWLDKAILFFNRSVKSCLQDGNIKMYSIHYKAYLPNIELLKYGEI